MISIIETISKGAILIVWECRRMSIGIVQVHKMK